MNSLRRWLLLSLLLHLVAAVFSVGYYHADEHFQILEFMSYKLGTTPAGALPLEFHQMLRSWLQPGLYYAVARVISVFSSPGPFALALVLRIFTALAGWSATVGVLLVSRRWLSERAFRLATVASALLWFLPAFHARVSSENLGGAVVFLALALLLASREAPGALVSLGCGALLGAAFELRFQTGFMIAGLLAWIAVFGEEQRRRLPALVAGILAAIALGTCVDRWGYGTWTFAPWNYFHFNLVENHVSDIDTHPFWDFFRSSFTETWPPLGFLVLVSWLVAWVRFPRHILTWTTLPLFAIHTIIGHKELRFLFPIAHAAPVLLALACEGLDLGRIPVAAKRVLQAAFAVLTIDNGLALLALCLVPAWMPPLLYQKVDALAHASSGPFTLYYDERDPYEILGSKVSFYRPPNLRLERVSAPDSAWPSPNERTWLFHPGVQLSGAWSQQCALSYSTLPPWLLTWNPFGAASRMTNWALFECVRPVPPKPSS